MAAVGSSWDDFSADQRAALAAVGVEGELGLAVADPLVLAENLGWSMDEAVRAIVAARQRRGALSGEASADPGANASPARGPGGRDEAGTGASVPFMERMDEPGQGFVEVPPSARLVRGARLAERVEASRGALRVARRRIRRADAGRKPARIARRLRRRLGDIAVDLRIRGVSRRSKDALEPILDRLDDATSAFLDGRPTRRRARRMRKRLKAVEARLDGAWTS